jgi:DNA mismatch repair endonuclease MutH
VLSQTYDQIRALLGPFVGVPFQELADDLGVEGIDRPAANRKGFAGQMTEAMLRIAANSSPLADLADIGAEVKSVPLYPSGAPRENTKVTSLTLRTVGSDEDFFTSHLYAKMRAIIFMPIQKNDNDVPHLWYLRPPFLWLPSTEELAIIRTEYGRYLEAIGARDWSRLNLREGRYLGVNTSGPLSRGMAPEDKPYAWWLKRELTTQILQRNLDPRHGVLATAHPTDTELDGA